MKKLNLLPMLGILATTTVFAQAGNGAGNGGGEDGVFKSIRDEIKVWMDKNARIGKLDEKLETADANNVYQKYLSAIAQVGEKIIFTNDTISFNGNVRTCKNEPSLSTITCNVDSWNNTRGDTRYMIVLHEYLGIAGVESNVNEYSRYPVSPKILGFVKTKNSFELSLNKIKNTIKIPIKTLFNDFETLSNNENNFKEYIKNELNVESLIIKFNKFSPVHYDPFLNLRKYSSTFSATSNSLKKNNISLNCDAMFEIRTTSIAKIQIENKKRNLKILKKIDSNNNWNNLEKTVETFIEFAQTEPFNNKLKQYNFKSKLLQKLINAYYNDQYQNDFDTRTNQRLAQAATLIKYNSEELKQTIIKTDFKFNCI